MSASRVSRKSFLVALVLWGLATPDRTLRADDARMRIAVWGQQTDVDRAFVERVRGQTVELPVELLDVTRPVPGPNLDTQVQQADALSRIHRARGVIWRAHDQVFLFLATPAPSRLLARRVGTRGPGYSHVTPSADLEAGALVVRTALRAVLEGTTVGVPHVFAPPVPPKPPDAQPGAPTAESAFYGILLGDFRLGSDGAGNSLPRGFGAHLGIGWRRFAVGFTGMITLDRDVGISQPQPYWRQNAALFLDLDVFRRDRVRVTLEAQGGMAYFNLTRSTDTVRRPHAFVGTELRGAFEAYAASRFRMLICFGLGADVIPDAPPLTMGPNGPILWPARKFQPRAMLGTGIVF